MNQLTKIARDRVDAKTTVRWNYVIAAVAGVVLGIMLGLGV